MSLRDRFVPKESLTSSMQSSLQSHPGHNQPSSPGGTVSHRSKYISDKEPGSMKWSINQVDQRLLSSVNNGGSKQSW